MLLQGTNFSYHFFSNAHHVTLISLSLTVTYKIDQHMVGTDYFFHNYIIIKAPINILFTFIR